MTQPYVVTDKEELEAMKVNLGKKNAILKQMVSVEDFDPVRLKTVDCSDAAWVGGKQGTEFFDGILRAASVLGD